MCSSVFASDGRLQYGIVATLKYDYIASCALVQFVVRSKASIETSR